MRRTITLLTILLLVVFMIGCENSINPIQPQTQIDNEGMSLAKPFVGEDNQVLTKKGPKGPKPQKPNELYVPNQYLTIQEAVNAASEGDIIFVGPGTFAGAVIEKGIELRGVGKALINDGPILASGTPIGDLNIGFFFPGGYNGNGTIIGHFEFDILEFPVFSRGADNVTVEHCKMSNPIQGITNWIGNGWKIEHNEIIDLQTLNGGGIGILIGDNSLRTGGIFGNVISYNTIKGTLKVWSGDGGLYDGTGIVLYSDERWSRVGAESIHNNMVSFNKISLTSDTPGVVDVNGIELTDTQNIEDTNLIFDNTVKRNILKDNAESIVFTPLSLEAVNFVEKNVIKYCSKKKLISIRSMVS